MRKLEPTVTPHLSLLSCFFLFKTILNKRIHYMLKLYYRIKLGMTFFILTFNWKFSHTQTIAHYYSSAGLEDKNSKAVPVNDEIFKIS